MGGAVDAGLEYHSPFFDGRFVALLGIFGVGLGTELPQQLGQLPGGQFRSLFQHLSGDFLRPVGVEVICAVEDEVGPATVDTTRNQRLPHRRQTRLEVPGDGQFAVGGFAGEPQRGANLRRAGVFDQLKVGLAVVAQLLGDGVGHRNHRGVHLRLIVRRHPLVSGHHDHPVVARQSVDVDCRQEGGEHDPRLHLRQIYWDRRRSRTCALRACNHRTKADIAAVGFGEPRVGRVLSCQHIEHMFDHTNKPRQKTPHRRHIQRNTPGPSGCSERV